MALSGSLNTGNYQGRYYKLSWSAEQSIADNTSTISWSLEALGGSVNYYAERTLKVVIDGATVYSKTDKVNRYKGVVATGTKTLKHDNLGNKSFSVSIEAAVYTSSINCTGSSSFTLNPIPRKATITSAPNFNDEENPTITYSNLAGNSVDKLQACISFDGTTADVPYREISKSGTSYTFNLTSAERATLRLGVLSGDSTTVWFFIRTTINGTNYHHSVAKTLTLINHKPTMNPVVEDVNETTLALTGDKNKLIKYYSTARVTPNAQAYKEAVIAECHVDSGSKGAIVIGDYADIKEVDSGKFNFVAMDDRGTKVEKTITKTLIEYINVTCKQDVSIALSGETEASVTLKITGQYFKGSFGAKSNVLNLFIRYTNESGTMGDWIKLTGTPTFNGNEYTLTHTVPGLRYDKSYTFQSYAGDMLGEQYTTQYTVKLIPVFDWSDDDFNFNVPVSINNQPIADFVVAQGTSNGFYYRKWNSGRAELFGEFTYTGAIDQQKGSLYRTNSISVSLPFSLGSCRAWCECSDGNTWGSTASYSAKTSTINCILWSPWTVASGGSLKYQVNVVGTWK